MEENKVVPQRPAKSPAAAAWLSILFPFGVGALYNGQKNKALVQLLIPFGLIYALTRGGNGVLFGLSLAAFYFYQIFDNIQSAKAINEAAAGQLAAIDAIPEAADIKPSGSIFWGILLIVLGFILILANFEIIAYRSLDNYWPIAVIIIGLKLVADSVAKSKNGK
jgi:hypothetical protein